MNRRRLHITSVLLLILTGLCLPAPAEPDVGEATAYLKSVRDHLLNSYAFGDRLTKKELLGAGRKELLNTLRNNRNAPVGDRRMRSFLIKRLRNRSFKSIDDLGNLLRRTRKRFKNGPVPIVKLSDVMAKGMIRKTGDPYSRIMTIQDLNELRKQLMGQGTSKNLGLHLRFQKGQYRVIYVQYRTAADRAGIRSGDVVVSVDGVKLKKKMSSEKLQGLLRADFGETVRMRIRRPGWNRAHEFVLNQAYPGADMVESKLLPDDVGYVRLTRFGLTAASRLRSTLSDLHERGMDTLVFDLRNNPGGALPIAVDVVDLFLPGKRIITRTKTHYRLNSRMIRIVRRVLGFGPLTGDRRAGKPSPFEEIDMAVLVNGSTASASELTAGALQDHDRATVIGQTTFGKGVGQAAIPLKSTTGFGGSGELDFLSSFLPSRFLYLTILTYRLPSGRSINNKGLRPDIRIQPLVFSEEQINTLLMIRQSNVLKTYIRKQMSRHRKKMQSLARYDGFDASRYPSFDNLLRRIKNNVAPDVSRSLLRRELRRSVRAYFTTARAVRFTVDLQNDPVLQAGILFLSQGK